LVVGARPHANAYLNLVQEHPHWGIDVVGLVDPKDSNALVNGQVNVYVNGNHQQAGALTSAPIVSVVDEVVAVCPWEGAPASTLSQRFVPNAASFFDF
jgi:hypothetical protein